MSVRTFELIGAVATCLALTACSAAGPSPTNPGAASPSPTSVGSSASSDAPTRSASPPAGTTGATATATTVAAAGHCSTIDQATAATILGFASTPGVSSKAGSADPRFLKLDDCLYQSAASGSLGYTVVQVDAAMARSMVQAAKAKMAVAGGLVVTFTSGITNSVAFTMHLPQGVDSQITAQAGDRLLSVASTRKDGDTAKSQASAVAAMQALIAAG